LVIETATRGKLPLLFSGKVTSTPTSVSQSIFKGHLNDRMSLSSLQIAARALRMTPAGAVDHTPPPRRIAGPEAGGADEDERGGFEQLGRHTWIKRRIRGSLGKGHIASRIDKLGELAVRDLSPVNGERLDHNATRRAFLWIFRLRAKNIIPTLKLYLILNQIRATASYIFGGEITGGPRALLGFTTAHDDQRQARQHP
jgi:hypothetical protein